jgi:hypothetical protein
VGEIGNGKAKSVVRLSSFRLSPAPCNRPSTQPFGFSVGQVELANSLASIGKGDPSSRAFTLGYLFAALV